MPQYIIKLSDKYLMWSTVVDAPISSGMELDEFIEVYTQQYGCSDLCERLERVEKTGTSAKEETLDEVINYNRAGENETCLTRKELIERYCNT